jgi:hypothetical protein
MDLELLKLIDSQRTEMIGMWIVLSVNVAMVVYLMWRDGR